MGKTILSEFRCDNPECASSLVLRQGDDFSAIEDWYMVQHGDTTRYFCSSDCVGLWALGPVLQAVEVEVVERADLDGQSEAPSPEEAPTPEARKEGVQIRVNGEQRVVLATTLTYDQIVGLSLSPEPMAFPLPTARLFTVIYEHGPEANREGSVLPGQSVEVADGMKFTALITGSA